VNISNRDCWRASIGSLCTKNQSFWKQRRGKDEHDDLEREIKPKIEEGYPTSNIIFQASEKAIRYQRWDTPRPE
jgi:hypothetical protein